MSFSSPGRVNVFTGNGTADPLVTTFKVHASSELRVVRYDVSAGTYTALSLGADFTVVLGATLPSTATITPTAVIDSPDKWYVWREAPRTQLVDYTPGGNFPAETHEQALDRLAMLLDELSELEGRSVRIRIDDDGPNGASWQSMLIPRRADRASKALGFDANGAIAAITAVPAGSVAFTAIGEAIAEAADAAAIRGAAILSVPRNVGGATPLANVGAGTIGARPTPGDHGQGFYIATDERRLYYSSGAAWTEVAVVQAAQASLLTTPAGMLQVSSDSRQLYRASGSAAQLVRSSPPRYGHGCKVIWDSATALSFEPGRWRSMLPTANEDELDLVLGTTMQKLANATWAVGTAAGGMAQGVALAANQWLNAFLIGTPGGLVDIGYDTSLTAANLLADTNVLAWAGGAPIRARRIRSFRTKFAAAEILQILQRGDEIYYVNLNGQPTEAGIGTTGLERDDAGGIDYFTAPVAVALPRVPPGIECEVHVHAWGIAGLGFWRIFPYGPTWPTVTNINGNWPPAQLAASTTGWSFSRVWTDTSRRITLKTDSAAGPDDRLLLALFSYRDPLDRI